MDERHGVRTEPQQARSCLKRELILDAAQALIFERGYGALTIALVARRAGIGKQTVYQMFAHKEAILFALCERKSDRIDAHNSAYMAQAAPKGWREMVRASSVSFYEINREDPSLDPIFIASQDVPALRLLDMEQNKSRVTSATALFSGLTGLENDQTLFEFTLSVTIAAASITRHALMYDDAVGRRLVEQHVISTIHRLERMGAK